MLDAPLAPYLLWAKTRHPAPIDLAGSNLVPCTLDDLPGWQGRADVAAPNDCGFAPVVEAIARHYGVEPARVAAAAGCSGANFLAAAALLSAGDDVLVEAPTYDPLIGACALMGAAVRRFPRRAEAGFAVDPDDVARLMTPRTKLVVLTSPHNPSGVAVPLETIGALARLAATHGAYVLVDEVYLDGACLAAGDTPAVRTAAGLDGPILVTNSLTKSYGLAGLRSGWVIAPTGVAERIRRTRDVVDNAASAPADRFAALAWDRLPALAARSRALLSRNLQRAREFFASSGAFDLPAAPSCSIVFPRLAGHADSEPIVARLLERYGVAVAPGRFFDARDRFRVSLAGRPETLARGLDALGRAASEL